MSDAVGFIKADNQEPEIGLEVKAIQERIGRAQSSYRLARDAALETVGHIVLVWLEVLSSAAKKGSKQWYKSEIEKRRDDVNEHIAQINMEYKRADDFMAGKLKPEDPINVKAKDEQQRTQQEAEKAKLRELARHTSEQRYARKRVRYTPEDKGAAINDLVKYVLNLDSTTETDIVSRYVMVTEWVTGQIIEAKIQDVKDVVDLLKAGGGFEAVLAAQRALKNASNENEDEKILNADIKEQAKVLVQGMPAKTTLDYYSHYAKDGYVLMLARTNGGQADILGEIPVTENDIASAILHVSDEIKDPASPHCEFLARAVQLGRIVPEGEDGGVKRGSTQSGEVIRSQRSMVIRPGDDGRAKIVVSARYVDSSPVIHIWPRQWPEFNEIKQDVILPSNNLKRLERDLSNLTKRRRIEYDINLSPKLSDNVTPAKSPMSFEVVYAALEEKGRENARQQYYWNYMGNTEHKPVDKEFFDAQFQDSLDQEDIALLLTGPFEKWLSDQASTKNKSPVVFSYVGRELSVKVNGQEPLTFTRSKEMKSKYTMSFKARDFHRLLRELSNQDCQSFTMKGDEGGLLEISWSDDLADYAVYMPTVNLKGELETRRVSHMRIKTIQDAAE